MLNRNSVFRAYCFEHPCRIEAGDGLVAGWASLVSITPETARVHLNTDLGGDLRVGQSVTLRPLFSETVDMRISARVRYEDGDCLHLRFDPALPLTGFDLARMARKA